MLKIGALVSGGGTNLQAIMDAVDSGDIDGKIVTVVSNRKDAYALERAKKNNIETAWISKKQFSSVDEYEDALIEHFKSRDVGLIVFAGFMVILTSKFTDAFKNKIKLFIIHTLFPTVKDIFVSYAAIDPIANRYPYHTT